MNPKVAAVLEAYPAQLRERLMRLRSLIQETAAAISGIGPLEETLKWGEVSYLTPSGSGTTVRIGRDKHSGLSAVYVNCQTDLVERYRELYPSFSFEGSRAVLVPPDADEDAVRHMVGMALTYHADKRRRS